MAKLFFFFFFFHLLLTHMYVLYTYPNSFFIFFFFSFLAIKIVFFFSRISHASATHTQSWFRKDRRKEKKIWEQDWSSAGQRERTHINHNPSTFTKATHTNPINSALHRVIWGSLVQSSCNHPSAPLHPPRNVGKSNLLHSFHHRLLLPLSLFCSSWGKISNLISCHLAVVDRHFDNAFGRDRWSVRDPGDCQSRDLGFGREGISRLLSIRLMAFLRKNE